MSKRYGRRRELHPTHVSCLSPLVCLAAPFSRRCLCRPSRTFFTRLSTPPNQTRTPPNSSSNGRRRPPPTISPSCDVTRGIYVLPSLCNLSQRFRPARNSGRLAHLHRCSRTILSGRLSPSASPTGLNSPFLTFPTRSVSRTYQLASLARGNHKSARCHEAKLLEMQPLSCLTARWRSWEWCRSQL